MLIVFLIGVVAVLTQEEEDPCANPQADISAAVLADSEHDSDALANRAILMRGKCPQPAPQATPAPNDINSQSESNSQPDPNDIGIKTGMRWSLFASAIAADSTVQPSTSQLQSAPPTAVSTDTPMEIIEHRCMVCHGCYDAPCQLKLEAQAGLERGASKDLVYDGGRLITANLTRLFDDAYTNKQWREKGFYPVINNQDPEQGVMYRLLELKQEHPLPTEGPVPAGFDFSLARDQQCPKEDEFDAYADEKPLWGMPYGLPGLSQQQHKTLTGWLEQGAPPPALAPVPAATQDLLADWEAFLNGDTPRQRLMARYIYEHLFLANLYLYESDHPLWFRLVRSRTAPGEPLQLISTRRPYDDPGVDRVYYRLQRMPVTALDKTHMPYRFDQERMDWYRQLFIEPDYKVVSLPGYAQDVAANPFKAFVDLPIDSRYRFILEESRFTIMNFIKGPVCRGQIALNVIDDHFWVVFANPDRMDIEVDARFLAREMDKMRLPTPTTGTPIDLLSWRAYAKSHERYQRARSRFIRKKVAQGRRLSLNSIWDGDGHNPNAALTIFRHFDTASVETGLIGNVPKTAWVIDYPLLERIHYLLVAGFDVYGSVSHQLESRLYMDFLRMEGEFNFLLFMPQDQRLPLWDHWYRDAPKGTRSHFIERSALEQDTAAIEYSTDDPKAELLTMLRDRLYGAEAPTFAYRGRGAPDQVVTTLAAMEAAVGAHNSFLPDVSFINLIGREQDRFYTMLRNSAHSNIAQLFREDERRLPGEDSITLVQGFIGAYPNYFFQVEETELTKFAADIAALKSEKEYQALLTRYGVRRNAPWFWRFVDKAHARYEWQNPVEYGLFDLNRYSSD
ncbi:fatty acid cis/trans isomerase [Pseudohalioglobus lutimaris]|uniref:fatty acid cis/trans isomerase n=1 Tax=Pseudohalioglobus lutimaris TaxID=1737061 RepID=UPI001FAFF7B5|nr:fatty acid cis/trans isomerase [Pseudohalioglobus lutimaris]